MQELTYEDAELPIKHGGHSPHELLPLSSNRHITDRPSNPKTQTIPFPQAPIQLTPISTTRVHSRPKPHQFLHNCMPENQTKFQIFTNHKREKKNPKYTSNHLCVNMPNSASASGDKSVHSAERPSRIVYWATVRA
jgi:hypothetical protein